MRGKLWMLAAAVGCVYAGAVGAADLDKKVFNVVGTWGNLTNWQKIEAPFWKEQLPKDSGGKLTANAKAYTEVNLKGTEVMRLLKQGVFDAVAALPIYVDEGGAVLEAVDIAGVAPSFAVARKITEAWRPEMQKILKEKYNAQIVALWPFPEQVFFCKGQINSIADLKGKKIRVQGTSQGDIAESFGASGSTIVFAEVVPALDKGVVDCAITGTMPGYKAKLYEVTNTLFHLPVGYTIGFWAVNLNSWNKLSKPTRDFMTKEFKQLEDNSWKVIEAESDEGIACNTGKGQCSVGKQANLTLVEPSKADVAARAKALNEVVLKRWAKRCGDKCAADWNAKVGKLVGLTASAK